MIVKSGRRIIGFDLCEVGDSSDGWDANVGSRVLYQLCGALLASQGKILYKSSLFKKQGFKALFLFLLTNAGSKKGIICFFS